MVCWRKTEVEPDKDLSPVHCLDRRWGECGECGVGQGWRAAVIWGHGFMREEKAWANWCGWFSAAPVWLEGQGLPGGLRAATGRGAATLAEQPGAAEGLCDDDILLSHRREERPRLCPSCEATSVWAAGEGSRPPEEQDNNRGLSFSQSDKYASLMAITYHYNI